MKRFNGIFTLFGKRERSQVSSVFENISTFPPEVGMCSLLYITILKGIQLSNILSCRFTLKGVQMDKRVEMLLKRS